jgi:hypothetical protein
MATLRQAAQYERLFLLNRCLEQVAEILEQFRQDGVVLRCLPAIGSALLRICAPT